MTNPLLYFSPCRQTQVSQILSFTQWRSCVSIPPAARSTNIKNSILNNFFHIPQSMYYTDDWDKKNTNYRHELSSPMIFLSTLSNIFFLIWFLFSEIFEYLPVFLNSIILSTLHLGGQEKTGSSNKIDKWSKD